jgi:4-hydroxy-2-oxoheptanedioate aldolase
MERKNIKKMIANNQLALGFTVNIPDPTIAELAGLAGFDFLRLDGGHYIFTPDVIAKFVRAADSVGVPVIVRVTDIQSASVLLDCGVAGIMVPSVKSAAHAKEIVDLLKYQPLGYRQMCGSARAQKYGAVSMEEYMKQANDEVIIVAQIEDKEGIANMEEIVRVQGLDLLCTGRGDLSQALGFGGQMNHPEVIATEDRILECAEKAGLALQLSAYDMKQAKIFVDRGVRALTIGSDISQLKKKFSELVETRRHLPVKV